MRAPHNPPVPEDSAAVAAVAAAAAAAAEEERAVVPAVPRDPGALRSQWYARGLWACVRLREGMGISRYATSVSPCLPLPARAVRRKAEADMPCTVAVRCHLLTGAPLDLWNRDPTRVLRSDPGGRHLACFPGWPDRPGQRLVALHECGSCPLRPRPSSHLPCALRATPRGSW